MPNLSLSFASKEASLSVRRFSVRERMSSLFEVCVLAASERDALDLDSIVGKPAAFKVDSGTPHPLSPARVWAGLCADMEQVKAEPTGLSTYRLRIVPWLFRTTLRSSSRIFQHLTIPEIVLRILDEWEIQPEIVPANGNPNLFRFTQEYPFDSPSGAAAVVSGIGLNGRVACKVKNEWISYKEWQEKVVASEVSDAS
ncbi:contractile injection system protein, VgrG/Pvc8 family [Sorangium sp. So ce429]